MQPLEYYSLTSLSGGAFFPVWSETLTTHSDTWLKTIAELYGDDYLNDLLYDPSEGQSDNMAEAPKYSSRQIGGSIYTEFGKIAGVEHDERYLTLINEHGKHILMKKVYFGWARVYQQALYCKENGRSVVYETGASALNYASDYFRDLVVESAHIGFIPSQRIFAPLPESGLSDAVKDEILKWRLRARDAEFRFDQVRTQYSNLKDELEIMTVQEKAQAKSASKSLDQWWSTFEGQQKTIVIAGKHHTSSKYPKKIDISFASRLGVDVTTRKRIGVEVLDRVKDKNQIVCRLLDRKSFTETITMSIVPHGKNEWAAASVENGLSGWFEIENKDYQHLKSARQPIEYFLEAHNEMLNKWVDRELPSSTLDAGDDIAHDNTV